MTPRLIEVHQLADDPTIWEYTYGLGKQRHAESMRCYQMIGANPNAWPPTEDEKHARAYIKWSLGCLSPYYWESKYRETQRGSILSSLGI